MVNIGPWWFEKRFHPAFFLKHQMTEEVPVQQQDPNDVEDVPLSEKAESVLFRIRTVLKGHNAAITSLQVSADNNLLVSGSRDRTALVWSLHKTQECWA